MAKTLQLICQSILMNCHLYPIIRRHVFVNHIAQAISKNPLNRTILPCKFDIVRMKEKSASMIEESDKIFESLQVSLEAFQNFGIDILNAKKNGKIIKDPRKFMIQLLSGMFCAILILIYAVIHRHDMVEIARGLCLFTPWLLGIMKTLICVSKARKFSDLIEDLKILANGAEELEKPILLEENKFALLITRMYYFIAYAGVVFVGSLPVFIMVFTYVTTGIFVLEPPYRGIYLFYDYHRPLYYILSYVVFIFFIRNLVDGSLHIDSLLLWCIQNISAHFLILHEKFKMAAEELTNVQPTSAFRDKFIAAVEYHCRLIRLTNDLNGAYELIVLVEVTISVFQLCMFVYQARSGPEMGQVPIIVLALIGMSLQLSIYCFGGQKIQNLSEKTTERIFLFFPWEMMRPQEKRLLLLPLMRAQRPQTLSGYLFVTNNNLIIVVFKTTFSISTLFAAVNNKI